MSAPPAERFSVVVVGARIAGAAAARVLAPHVGDVLLLDRGGPAAFWPQAASWDRHTNLLWSELGLLDTVLGCGAPRITGHTFRTLDTEVVHDYPDDDEHCYRMGVAREDLDPALAAAAAAEGNVTLLRRAKVTGVLREGERAVGVTYLHGGTVHEVRCDLVVFADGRVSRNADRLGAQPYATLPSPWAALLYYCENVGLPAKRSYYSRQPGSVVVVVPTGPTTWCVSASVHQDLVRRSGRPAVRVFDDLVSGDALVGAAVRGGTRVSPVGGAGRLRLLRRPMAGPGWCLVGDCGYFLDPITALGTKAALASVRLLRDRVADAGTLTSPTLHTGLTRRRDDLLDADWQRTVAAVGTFGPADTHVARARVLAADPRAALAVTRAQMGLAPPADRAPTE